MLRIDRIEKAAQLNRDELVRFGTALLFIVGIMLFTIVRTDGGTQGVLLVIAAMIGGYMAMNIGANDVANNVGPAVGSHAITLVGAITIAAVFEASGALIAGGDVVGTIKKGIIDPELIPSRDTFIWLMIAALLAAALWPQCCHRAGRSGFDDPFHCRRRSGRGDRCGRLGDCRLEPGRPDRGELGCPRLFSAASSPLSFFI